MVETYIEHRKIKEKTGYFSQITYIRIIYDQPSINIKKETPEKVPRIRVHEDGKLEKISNG